ncbi:MAG: glutamine amidotransferase-related protein [Candidatus Woesearchaeota archaeon]
MYTLIINAAKDELHYYEFVKPIENILIKNNKDFKTIAYHELGLLKKEKLKKLLYDSERIIISGTSLKDFEYLKPKNIRLFGFLKEYNKPVLGICAGMQIIGKVLGNKTIKKAGIGLNQMLLKEDFLSLKKGTNIEVYELHNSSTILKGFKECSKHNAYQKDNFYCTLFHPEVRNREIIETFLYR